MLLGFRSCVLLKIQVTVIKDVLDCHTIVLVYELLTIDWVIKDVHWRSMVDQCRAESHFGSRQLKKVVEGGVLVNERFNVACIWQEHKLACLSLDRLLADHIRRHHCAIVKRHRLTRSQHLEVLPRLTAELGCLLW